MANLKISAATPKAALATTDMIPLAAVGDATAYHVTGQAVLDYVAANITDLPALESANAITSAAALEQVSPVLKVGESGVPGVIRIGNEEGIDWLIAANQSTFEGMPDDLLFIGYNPRSDPEGLGYQDAAKHKWYMGMEADYYTSETDHLCEWYLQFIAPSSELFNRRPIYSVVDLETYAMQTNYRGLIRWYTSDNDIILQTDDTTPGGTISITGQTLIFNTNNQAIISGARAGGGAAIEVLKVNASDQIVMGTHVVNTDDFEVTNSSNGFILADKADSKRYRISVRNGVLETAEVA